MAIALAGDPRVLFLDEPTTGFDPGARRSAWETIKGLASLGKTIFWTSHSRDEVSTFRDTVPTMPAARWVAEVTPARWVGRGKARRPMRFGVHSSAPEIPPQ